MNHARFKQQNRQTTIVKVDGTGSVESKETIQQPTQIVVNHKMSQEIISKVPASHPSLPREEETYLSCFHFSVKLTTFLMQTNPPCGTFVKTFQLGYLIITKEYINTLKVKVDHGLQKRATVIQSIICLLLSSYLMSEQLGY